MDQSLEFATGRRDHGRRTSQILRMDETGVPKQAEGPSHNTPAAKRCTQNHNQVAEPCQVTEYQPHYEDLETDKGTLTACTDYVQDLRKKLADKELQLAASQQECQEANNALSQARAKLTQQQEQTARCQMRIRELADQIEQIKVNTLSKFEGLSEDVDKQLTEAQTDISAIISQLPSSPEPPEPPSVIWEGEGAVPKPKQMEPGPIKPELAESAPRNETVPEEHTLEEHSPAENHANGHGKQLGINCNEESNAAGINKEPVMPTDKTWQDLLKDPAETTKTNPELGAPATKVVDVRITQQAPEPIKRLRRKKVHKTAKPSAKQIPHVISILKKTHITEPAPPTAEVRENDQAGSPDEPSPAQQLIEQGEDEEWTDWTDWTEFVAQPPKEFEEPRPTPITTPQDDTDPPNDVIVRDDETQRTYVELKPIL